MVSLLFSTVQQCFGHTLQAGLHVWAHATLLRDGCIPRALSTPKGSGFGGAGWPGLFDPGVAVIFHGLQEPMLLSAYLPSLLWKAATDTQKVDHQKGFDKSFHFCRPWMSLSLLQDLGKCGQGWRWLLCCLPVIHTQRSSSKSKAGPKIGFSEIPYLTLLSKSLTVVAFNFSHNVLRLWYLNSFSFQLILAFQ